MQHVSTVGSPKAAHIGEVGGGEEHISSQRLLILLELLH